MTPIARRGHPYLMDATRPLISARVKVVPGLIQTEGDTFQPWPSSLAACLPRTVGGHAGFAFSPVKFSG